LGKIETVVVQPAWGSVVTLNDSVVIVATVEAAEGQEEKLEQVFRTAIPAIHAEPGCELYALHRDPASPSTFVLFEKWASPDALRTHLEGPVLSEFGAVVEGLLAGPMKVQTLTPLPLGDAQLGRV
jgi:quinol monooxygenase YgiN